MTPQEARKIVETLRDHYRESLPPEHTTGRGSPFQVLILTILSAQTTDRAVDQVRGPLFRRYPNPRDLAGADPAEVEEIISSLGLFHSKARYIVETSRRLVEEFDGKVPRDMDDLLTLSGVGRKTANIVLYHAFGINRGVAVDTHVKRVAKRIGFTDSTDPDTIENDLVRLLPREVWGLFTDLLIVHGRTLCTARDPRCPVCPVRDRCRYYASARKQGQ